MGKRVVITISAIVLLIGAGVWWLFGSGRLVYVGAPGDGSSNVGSRGAAICGRDVVDAFNDAATYKLREGFDEMDIDLQGLAAVRTDVRELGGYENDPTCQALLFQIAVYEDDYTSAKVAHETVVKLHDEGVFPDNNILGVGTLDQHENYLQGLSGFDGVTGLEDEGTE